MPNACVAFRVGGDRQVLRSSQRECCRGTANGFGRDHRSGRHNAARLLENVRAPYISTASSQMELKATVINMGTSATFR